LPHAAVKCNTEGGAVSSSAVRQTISPPSSNSLIRPQSEQITAPLLVIDDGAVTPFLQGISVTLLLLCLPSFGKREQTDSRSQAVHYCKYVLCSSSSSSSSRRRRRRRRRRRKNICVDFDIHLLLLLVAFAAISGYSSSSE
jgi:hypothetical protein